MRFDYANFSGIGDNCRKIHIPFCWTVTPYVSNATNPTNYVRVCQGLLQKNH